LTRRISRCAGKRESRDIPKTIREHAAQRHQELADRHDNPKPNTHGPRVLQHVVVCRKDANRHRDERERDREYLKGAEGRFELGW
jgi:hypothetical protein